MNWQQEFARTNLIRFLDENCRPLYKADQLTEAVSQSLQMGMNEVQAQARAMFCLETGLQETGVDGILASADGSGYLFTLAPDNLNPAVLTLAILAYAGLPQPMASRSWKLSEIGRYARLKATFPAHAEAAVIVISGLIEALLNTLTAWLEQQMQITIHEFHRAVSGQVYEELSRATQIDFGKRLVDVAIIGPTSAWRIPHSQSIDRTLRRLRGTSASHDAELLTASFVSSILPRDSTLMVQALQADKSIVRPFANAPWYTARTFFALATRLRHEGEANQDTTSSMLAVYSGYKINVILIYPATDTELGSLLEDKRQEMADYIGSHVRLFQKTLAVVEKTGTSTNLEFKDGMARVFKILAYETGQFDNPVDRSRRHFRWGGRK